MTPQQILALAREGDSGALGTDSAAVAEAVRNFAEAGDAASSLELIGRTWRMWTSSGRLDEGTAAAQAALASTGAPDVNPWYARALYADGVLAFRAGDGVRSRARNEEALRVARETGDARGECDAMTGLARLALRDGRYAEVARLARSARARARQAGDVEAEGPPLHLEAAGVRLQGEYAAARDLYLQSIDLNRTLGRLDVVAMELHNLGWVELHLGNIDAAAARFRERDAGADPDAYLNAWSDLNWAAIAATQGDIDAAQKRFNAGRKALDELGIVLDPDDKEEVEWLAQLLESRSC
jgi:tetratricopeptide (TPR) repeat protein